MPHHESLEVEGRVADVFAHRFVVERADGTRLLADLGPEGAKAFALAPGLVIAASGEMKPSELKVTRIARAGEAPMAIAHKPKRHGPAAHAENADPAVATRAVMGAGFTPIGEPRRKPKHFEVLGRKDGRLVECHVALDGHVRKERSVTVDDQKWSDVIRAAA